MLQQERAQIQAEQKQVQFRRRADTENQRAAFVRAQHELSPEEIEIEPFADLDAQLGDEIVLEPVAVPVTAQTSGSSDEFIDRKDFVDKLNRLLPTIGVEIIDFSKIESLSYCNRKIDDIMKNLSRRIFQTMPYTVTSEPPLLSNADNEMIEQLKAKFATATSREEKIRILSIAPQSWTANKIHTEFKISWYLANAVKALVQDKGIMCTPTKRLAPNVIPPELVKLVEEFYLCEDISHTCPGKRDYVTVNENNERVQLQRRLLLMNLHEAYTIFKEKHVDKKIGFSKFAVLRPPQCITALETGGTHSVCVCVYHQNTKLIFECIKNVLGMNTRTYRDLLSKMLCDNPNADCKLRNCANCPGEKAVEDYLSGCLENNLIDNVVYRQWTQQEGKNDVEYIEKFSFQCVKSNFDNLGRSNLEKITKPVDNFITDFIKQVAALIPHDFIAREQAEYLKKRKEEIQQGEYVVICDFSENYTFIIQVIAHFINLQSKILILKSYFAERNPVSLLGKRPVHHPSLRDLLQRL